MARFGRGDIVALGCFIEAIRDAGYRGPGAALAELIDNAWEAQASDVHISLEGSGDDLRVVVQDNGHGMTPSVLRLALQFGGTTRFESRQGPGRYGMGLPAASLSQAQRLDVYSWTTQGNVWWSYLDVQEVRQGRLTAVPRPCRRRPEWRSTLKRGPSGTIVVWSRCDRLGSRADLDRVLRAELGRVFREQVWAKRRLFLNGVAVEPVDPLCVRPGKNLEGAVPYGPLLEFPIDVVDDRGRRRVSKVLVRFVELPVTSWHGMSNEEKRAWGISKGAGVSVLRAGREIDAGWFFMGGKRKENYDDWWRCELRFEPELDELFGVNHTKQGIHPAEPLLRVLAPDMERIAHDLNRRVRSAFLRLKGGLGRAAVERARTRDRLLEPPAVHSREGRRRAVWRMSGRGKVAGLSYRIRADDLETECFYEPQLRGSELVVALNSEHPFFDEISRRVDGPDRSRLALELMLLAAARAEVRHATRERRVLARFRHRWGVALRAFLS